LGYRVKDETSLRWARIQRRLTRELDTQIKDMREEVLNGLLTGAYKEFVQATHEGRVIELENEPEWVRKALAESTRKVSV